MFDIRSDKKELLDEEHIPEEDLALNLKELHIINKFLGGYTVSVKALKKFVTRDKPIVLADIGCGGGDTLKEIAKYFSGSQLQLYGIDIKSFCVEYSKKNL